MIKTTLYTGLVLAGMTSMAFSDAKLSPSLDVDKITTGAVEAKNKDSEPNKPPLLSYKSHISSNGKIIVEFDEAQAERKAVKKDVMTVFAPDVRLTEIMLHAQDWYLQVDANGTMLGIYTVPRNQALPSSVVRRMGDGYGLLKVNPANSFFKVFPSKFELASQLTSFMEAARETTCKADNRPEKISASVDVKPGWSGAGKIAFSATWAVSDLCKTKVSAIKKQ